MDIEQEEYCFDVCFQEDTASVLINSCEQMLTEKLKSLMRFGTQSTRYKDVFYILQWRIISFTFILSVAKALDTKVI